MSITRDYLDSLEFEIVKQKYYNANKVNAKLEELKAGIIELLEENENLKKSAASPSVASETMKSSEALLNSAQQLATATIAEAQAKADKIIAVAQADAKRIVDEAGAQVASPAASAPAGLTEAQLDAIDELNNQLDALNTSHATQIFKLKQQLMNLAVGK